MPSPAPEPIRAGGNVQLPTANYKTYDGANRQATSCTDGIPAGTVCSGASVDQITNAYDDSGNVASATDASQ